MTDVTSCDIIIKRHITSLIYNKSNESQRGSKTKTSRRGLSVKIDYISIIFDRATVKTIITRLLGLLPMYFKDEYGKVQYKSYLRVYEMGAIRLYGDCQPSSENPQGLGCYLILSGKGCDELQCYLKTQKRTWQTFFADCFELYGNHFHFTRLDVAIDDKNEVPYFTVETIQKKCLKDEFLSRSRKYRFAESSFEGSNTAKTVYIGARKSGISYRFYDKDKEQASKSIENSTDLNSWKRTEIELRDETAHGFAMTLKEGNRDLRELAFGLLQSSLRFVTKDKNQPEKSRWQTSQFWERFLGDGELFKVESIELENSLSDTQEWMKTGGVLPAVVAFEFLDENGLLGDLDNLKDMKRNLRFSSELINKLVSHLIRIQREDMIPKWYERTKVEFK